MTRFQSVYRNLCRRRTGATFYEILTAVVLVGILSAFAMPFLLGQYQEERTQTLQRDNTANEIIKTFQATRIEKGLIPLSLGPSEIVLARLNQAKSSAISAENFAENVPEGCQEAVTPPAKKFMLQNNRINVFVADNWTESDTEGDHSQFCVQDTVLEKTTVHRVDRENETIGVLNSATGGSATITDSNSNSSAENSTLDISDTPEAVSAGETRITPKFISAYTNRNLSTSLQGTTYTLTGPGGFTTSGQGSISVNKPGRYSLRVDSFPSNTPGRSYQQSGTRTFEVGACYNPGTACEVSPSIPILDSYQLTVTLVSPYANEGNVPTNVLVEITSNRGLSQAQWVTITSYDDMNWMFPAGVYYVTLRGTDVRSQAINNIDLLHSPQRHAAFLEERNIINILAIGADGGGPNTPFHVTMTAMYNNTVMLGDTLHVGILQTFWPLVGDNLYLVHNGNAFFNTINHHSRYYTGVGLQDKETGQIATNAHEFVSTMTPIPSRSGTLFKGPPPENRTYRSRTWATPIKLHIGMSNVSVNDDDHFLMDIDGFTDNTTSPIRTPGGLNANEAWLILDRNHNGTWKNNTLDNDDLFGDHLGQVKNGYVDLEKTFAHEIKTDAKGNKYIDMRDHTLFGELQIQFARAFMGDTVPYAAYDLQLLTRDRRLIPARDSVDKLYVNYWDVQEYDKSGLNAIFQRAWVLYKNGQFKTSGDEYYALPNGIYQEVSDSEADKLGIRKTEKPKTH